ncbi:nuclear transport factor 2 family protein [Streptomyces sp. NPDC051771]|uniref:nuclear transport factor 2 family protein n=1 Tax=Streptomyces sp. NPDC051771 TaxID=3154847 RepID=UPI00343C8530
MDSGQEVFEISGLLSRYLVSLDDEEIDDAWARRLFTEDAHIDFPMSVHDGIDGLAAFHLHARAAFAGTQHLGSSVVTDVDDDGDHAALRANVLATHVHHPGAAADPLFQAGTLATARARRTAEGWRLASLSLRVLWTRGTPPGAQEPR